MKRVLAALAVAALPVAGVAAAASSATTAPARTSTSLSATPNASNAGGYVTFKGETNHILDGRWADLPNSTVTILYLVRGATTWHTFAQFKTNSTGNYSQRYRFNFTTTVHFHARVEPTASTARSYSPLVDVVPLTVYANCAALHAAYKHGVGRVGARDHVTSGQPVTTFFVSTALYNANIKLDRDKDGVACEAH